MTKKANEIIRNLEDIHSDIQFLQISAYDRDTKKDIMERIRWVQLDIGRSFRDEEEITVEEALEHALSVIADRIKLLEERGADDTSPKETEREVKVLQVALYLIEQERIIKNEKA